MYKKTNQTETFIEFTDGEKKVLVPTSSSIIVDENVGIKTLKATATRKTILNYEED